MDERWAAYEAIAYGEDPRITPADRMRALEKLDDIGALDEVDAHMVAAAKHFAALPDADLDEELTSLLAYDMTEFMSGLMKEAEAKMPTPDFWQEVEKRAVALAEVADDATIKAGIAKLEDEANAPSRKAWRAARRAVRRAAEATAAEAARQRDGDAGQGPPPGHDRLQRVPGHDKDFVPFPVSDLSPPGIDPKSLERQWPSSHRPRPTGENGSGLGFASPDGL